MVKILIENLGQKEVPVAQSGKTALHHFHAHFIDWMQSCGGKGRCTTCKMTILHGKENLGNPTAAEINYRKQGLLSDNERLACQVIVNGSIEIRVPDESKLPHLHYTS